MYPTIFFFFIFSTISLIAYFYCLVYPRMLIIFVCYRVSRLLTSEKYYYYYFIILNIYTEAFRTYKSNEKQETIVSPDRV